LSGRRRKRKRPEKPPIDFVLDECLAMKTDSVVFDAVANADEATATLLVDHFERRILSKDYEWIPRVAARGWVVLTQDENILRRRPEVDAWIASAAAVCVVKDAELTAEEAAELLQEVVPKIIRKIRKFDRSRAFIVVITNSGNIYVKYGRQGYPKNRTIDKFKWRNP